MATERETVKRSIVKQADAPLPPAMDGAIDRGTELEILIQNHGHLERMQAANLGWFGKVLGGERNASIVIAFIVILLSMSIATGLWIAAAHSQHPEFWSHEAQVAWSFAGAALAFIFGRTTAHHSKQP